jgi:hypothetical protein
MFWMNVGTRLGRPVSGLSLGAALNPSGSSADTETNSLLG